MKKIKRFLPILFVFPFLLASCNNTSSIDDIPVGEKDTNMFSSGDLKQYKGEDYTATINLSALTADYTITAAGVYHVKGSTKYQLIIEDNSSSNIHLVLDNVTMTNDANAPIYVKKSEKVVLHLLGENNIEATYTSEVIDGEDSINGAIFSKDDLTITGTGTLNVSSKLHGIVCKDDLKMIMGTINIKATKRGIDANDSFRMRDGNLNITSYGSVGIKLKSKKDDSFLYVEGGKIDITSYDEGIDLDYNVEATGYIKFVSGEIIINSGNDTNEAKAIKCASNIIITGGKFSLNSTDDGFHSVGSISIKNTNIQVTSLDDCIHSDDSIIVTSGNIILNGHEGLEADKVYVNNGNIYMDANDDGINASSVVEINGGYIDITLGTGDVDGIDSNGTYLQTGGVVVSRIPEVTITGCGAVDATKGVTFTGGTFIGVGSFTTVSTVKTSLSMVSFSDTFEAGTYKIKGTDISFELKESYDKITIVSDLFKSGSSYTLTKNDSDYITWNQDSNSVNK